MATGAEIAPDLEPVIDPFEPLADENFNNRILVGLRARNAELVAALEKMAADRLLPPGQVQ